MAFKNATVLTGGIATGKSTVAKLFLDDGFKIIDADKIAHEMLSLHKNEVAELFGTEYLKNGEIDRKKLGRLIFSNAKEKQRLESLLHPLIYSEIERESIELDKLKAPYLIDIPLFFENEGRYPIKEVIVVYTPRALQLERLMFRDKTTKKEALERIDSQMSIEEKKHRATYLIDNQEDRSTLQYQCDKLIDIIKKDFKGR